jgi:hypothetical protein
VGRQTQCTASHRPLQLDGHLHPAWGGVGGLGGCFDEHLAVNVAFFMEVTARRGSPHQDFQSPLGGARRDSFATDAFRIQSSVSGGGLYVQLQHLVSAAHIPSQRRADD